MDEEERLTLRDILEDFRKGHVELDYVEAHVACLIEEAVERVLPVRAPDQEGV